MGGRGGKKIGRRVRWKIKTRFQRRKTIEDKLEVVEEWETGEVSEEEEVEEDEEVEEEEEEVEEEEEDEEYEEAQGSVVDVEGRKRSKEEEIEEERSWEKEEGRWLQKEVKILGEQGIWGLKPFWKGFRGLKKWFKEIKLS